MCSQFNEETDQKLKYLAPLHTEPSGVGRPQEAKKNANSWLVRCLFLCVCVSDSDT